MSIGSTAERTSQRQSWGWAVVLGAVWIAILFAGMLRLMLMDVGGGTCTADTPSGEQYGEVEWSLVPLGPVCTWSTPDGSSGSSGPGPAMTVWLVALVGIGWVVLRVTPGAGHEPV